jgi:hypothetical protein
MFCSMPGYNSKKTWFCSLPGQNSQESCCNCVLSPGQNWLNFKCFRMLYFKQCRDFQKVRYGGISRGCPPAQPKLGRPKAPPPLLVQEPQRRPPAKAPPPQLVPVKAPPLRAKEVPDFEWCVDRHRRGQECVSKAPPPHINEVAAFKAPPPHINLPLPNTPQPPPPPTSANFYGHLRGEEFRRAWRSELRARGFIVPPEVPEID